LHRKAISRWASLLKDHYLKSGAAPAVPPGMKLVPPDQRRAISAVRLSLALAAIVMLPLLLYAAPVWWSQRNVLVQNAAPDDYAPANHGQLKNIARAAAAEMDAKLPGGAGDKIHALINTWLTPISQTNDFATVNLGQLKNVAKPFYDRLIAAGLVIRYPWTNVPNQSDDFAIANVGQVKNLFSFDLPAVDPLYDGDNNGVPDLWEQQYFGHTGIDLNADFDGDGISNLQEYRNHSDPTDFFNGTLATLTLSSGGDQRGDPGTLLPVPVSVRVSSLYSGVVWNAPVTVTIDQGAALLVADNSGTTAPSTTLALRTNVYDNEGYPVALVYVLLPPNPDFSIIRVSVQGGTRSLSVFTAAVAIDRSLAAPTNLTVIATSASTAKLSWTAAADTLPTTIQASIDDGRTWITVGTVGPGLNEATVTGLTPNRTTKFRLFAGGAPADNNTNSFVLPDPSNGFPRPIPPGAKGGDAGGPADVVPLAVPVVEVDQAEFEYGIGGGYSGMKPGTPGSFRLYKNKEIVATTHIPKTDDSEEYDGSTTQTFAWIPGNESFGRGDREVTGTSVTGEFGGALHEPFQTVIWTDSVLRWESIDLLPVGAASSKTITLSNPYTDADAEAAGAAANLQFYGEFYELRNNDLPAYFSHGHGHYYITVAKYRLKVNADSNAVALWDVQFTPENGGPVVHDIHSWHGDGSTYSPVFSLDPRLLNNGQNGSYRVVPISAELMVDANRDGEMSFDDQAVQDADQTSQEKPYQFWVNDDQDNVAIGTIPTSYVDGETISATNPDSGQPNILTPRDLEDWTRLWISFQDVREIVKDPLNQVELRLLRSEGQSPLIKVCLAAQSGGGWSYLTNAGAATAQISPVFGKTYGPIGPDGFNLKSIADVDWANGLAATDGKLYLLFEGVAEGKGILQVRIKRDGQVLVQYPDLFLDIKNVRRMYERAKITVEAPEIPDPWDNPQPPALQWTSDPWQWPPDVHATSDDAIIFVHGWRMTYAEYLSWADTTFKRLYRLGYKGRFYAFHWPTFNGENNGINPADLFVPGGTTYNPSEYRAWLSGPALANFVNSLPGSNKYLMAHSMGNVVAGSALRSGMKVTRYAMCNAALAAMAYDQNIVDFNYQTPDTDSDQATRSTFGLANKLNPSGTKLINFGLPADYALEQWSANNEFFKPEARLTANYYYRPLNSPGRKLTYEGFVTVRVVTSVAEAIGYVTQSRSAAEGTKQSLSGSINAVVNMGSGGFGFGTEHSAEWEFNMQRTYPFWREILHQFDLSVPSQPSP
jgi:hypothetical protein